MKILDRVHGACEIAEPAILELIAGPTMQRLKKIDQSGYFEPFFPGIGDSRFSHSVGVYLLLKKFGAPLEEQIAGLIHDVSHSAFSHCIDYIFNIGAEEKQDYQDNIFEDFVKRSEIPEILRSHGLDPEYILNDTNFPLKENDLPDLCADRIDYSLRTARLRDDFSEENIAEILAQLSVSNSRWVFTKREAAQKFADLFRSINTKYLSGIESAVMFKAVSDYLSRALLCAYITKRDLFTTDNAVLGKIAMHHDKELQRLFDRMNNKIPYVNDRTNYETIVKCKSRAVDPLYREGETVCRLSDTDPNWKTILEQESRPKEYFLRFDR